MPVRFSIGDLSKCKCCDKVLSACACLALLYGQAPPVTYVGAQFTITGQDPKTYEMPKGPVPSNDVIVVFNADSSSATATATIATANYSTIDMSRVFPNST